MSKKLVAYFSASGTTKKAASSPSGAARASAEPHGRVVEGVEAVLVSHATALGIRSVMAPARRRSR